MTGSIAFLSLATTALKKKREPIVPPQGQQSNQRPDVLSRVRSNTSNVSIQLGNAASSVSPKPAAISLPMPIPGAIAESTTHQGSPSSYASSAVSPAGGRRMSNSSDVVPPRHYFDNPRFLPHF
ncbi:hypothetical protein FRB99_002665 [Tulasnella sp. 403]|nr:hypothetical protein FRB99_002665 [Tulasnella sp. 403]